MARTRQRYRLDRTRQERPLRVSRGLRQFGENRRHAPRGHKAASTGHGLPRCRISPHLSRRPMLFRDRLLARSGMPSMASSAWRPVRPPRLGSRRDRPRHDEGDHIDDSTDFGSKLLDESTNGLTGAREARPAGPGLTVLVLIESFSGRLRPEDDDNSKGLRGPLGRLTPSEVRANCRKAARLQLRTAANGGDVTAPGSNSITFRAMGSTPMSMLYAAL